MPPLRERPEDIPRLARQSAADVYDQLPERVEYAGEFPSKIPVVLLITLTLGLISELF